MTTISVVTTEYEGDVPFPEAAHYPDYVADQLRDLYPGATVEVSTGLRSEVWTDNSNIDTHEVSTLVEVNLWDDFCAHGYKDYTDNDAAARR